ncbi:MAG: hypothetical protein J0M30_14485 [Chitinophagales bacterium]|nr:hypothetical protein [Chitinophagales bacterium]
MEAILYYLAESTIISGLLMTYYWFFLRNRKMNRFNRFYLLGTLLLSLLLPFIQINLPAGETNPLYIPTVSQAIINPIDQAANTSNTLNLVLIGIYALIALPLTGTFLYRIAWILKVRKTNPVEPFGGVNLIHTNLVQAPFSFLNNLFWRRSLPLEEESSRRMLQHELAHIRQLHSVDKLLMQIILCLLWINPFYWLLQKELTVVHEFLADEASIEEGDVSAFSAMLLRSFGIGQTISPAQGFRESSIKRRISMITKTRTGAHPFKWISLPLFISIFLIAACRQNQDKLPSVETTTHPAAEKLSLQEPVLNQNTNAADNPTLILKPVASNKDQYQIQVNDKKSEQTYILNTNGTRTIIAQ